MTKDSRYRADLNDPALINTDGDHELPPRTAPVKAPANVTAYFDDLEGRLIEHIGGARAVVGCVAWLTSDRILAALSQRNFVSILIQKEDFLRPDMGPNNRGWKSTLRLMYDSLRENDICRYDVKGIVKTLSQSSDPSIDPIRCVGFSGKEQSRPRMHHKFLVFCDVTHEHRENSLFGDPLYIQRLITGEHGPSQGYPVLSPYAVWTGSFNFTKTATNSLENAVFIHDSAIAERYFHEWQYVFALSEPLDWESEYCAPEYRLGT